MSGVSRSPGSGRTRAASTSPKIVAFTPIAIASEAIATSANNGRRWSTRTARRRFPGSQDRGTVSVPALLVHDATVEQLDRALGVAREPRIVRDHADRAALLVQVAQQVHHGLAVRRVQVSGRLVREQDQRVAGERAGHGDALLLAARELARQVLRAVRHAHALERLADPAPPLHRRHAAVRERQLDVLVYRQVADQVEALEDEPDLAVADPRPLGETQALDRLAVEPVLAVGRGVEQ